MPGRPQLTVAEQQRLIASRSKKFALQDVFKYGYRNKEDVSNLPPNVLVVGSQNVLTNAAELVGIRNGYVLDGDAGDQNDYSIDSAYDFEIRLGAIENLRKWGTNLQVRYQNPVTDAVSWVTIFSSLIAANVCNFTSFWDAITEIKKFCLFVNGDKNVYEWSGGVASFASATANSITVSGDFSLAQLGFYSNDVDVNKMNLLIDGVEYTYTGAGIDLNNAISNTGAGATQDIGTYFVDQLFTTGAGAQYIDSATVKIKSLSGGTHSYGIRGAIYTDSGGSPGVLAAQVQLPINALAAAEEREITFQFGSVGPTAAIVSGATNYHFVVSSVSVSPSQLAVFTDTSGSTGTQRSLKSPISWAGINGPMYLTVVENDALPMQFTGVAPDPSGAGIAVGDAIVQVPVVGAAGDPSNADFPSDFDFDLIATLKNQVWYGSLVSNLVYVSKTDNYKDTTFSTPARLPSEGALIALDASTVGFSPQAGQMYITAGSDQWWISQELDQTIDVSGVATPTQLLYASRLKTAFNQASQSQAFISRFKNSLIYVSDEPIINALGLVENINNDPQVVNLSDPIKFDVDAYDFTGGATFYDNYYIYVTVPVNGVVRMYNVQKNYWEAPQIIPISRFYHVLNSQGQTEIYGHSSSTNESYKLFEGYSDNGNPINAVAAFPYVCVQGGSPDMKKSFNSIYTEGYLAANTSLMVNVNYDFGGFSGTYADIINGADPNVIFNRVTDGSLGRNTLGSQPVGTVLNLPFTPVVPKFRSIKTMPRVDFFEYQIVYSTNEDDAQWTLLRFGPSVEGSQAIPVTITE